MTIGHQHEIEHEFEEGRFPRGWRGDSWCKKCNFAIYSREARRMEMFGLMRNTNPLQKHENDTGTADSAMFRVEDITVIRKKP